MPTQKQIDAAFAEVKEFDFYEAFTQQELIYISQAMEAYAEQRETPASTEGWIRVEDRLPDEGGRYWCYCESVGDLGKSYFQWNCSYDPIEKTFHDSSYSFKNGERVTHWMPLPQPPLGSNQNHKNESAN